MSNFGKELRGGYLPTHWNVFSKLITFFITLPKPGVKEVDVLLLQFVCFLVTKNLYTPINKKLLVYFRYRDEGYFVTSVCFTLNLRHPNV